MIERYLVGKPEAVDASTFGRFLWHLAVSLPPVPFRCTRVYKARMVSGGAVESSSYEVGKCLGMLLVRSLNC